MDDITDRQLKELENLNQLKDDFLSTVSHELRSPITNIKMAAQMLKLLLQQDEIDSNNSRRSVSDIQKHTIFKAKVEGYLLILEQECDREMNLLNNFLDLQQLDAGNYVANPTVVHLQAVIPQIIQPFVQRTAKQQQTLALETATHLPIVKIDQTSLKRILSELLTNACKFTPPGGSITVLPSCHATPYTATTLQLKVTNSNVEIPMSERDRIFDRFYRITNGDRWKHDGTGLGLTLVNKLAEHLGGSILVESGAGKTCFTVEIPVDQ
jgi:signal transduction histidine kinase